MKDSINKNKLSSEIESDKIKGFELKIDGSVQDLCNVYHATSGSTRSVIYILLIINIVAIIAVINTTPWNWTRARIHSGKDTITRDEEDQISMLTNYRTARQSLQEKLINEKKTELKQLDAKSLQYIDQKYNDSISKLGAIYQLNRIRDSDKIDRDMDKEKSLEHNRIDNSHHITIPLTNTSFDVNDLAIVSGVSFVILLIMLRFTLAREKDNLKIAFVAITERYVDNIVEVEYLDLIKDHSPPGMALSNFIKLVNFKRRRYHYNSLSMNEIFNLPKLDISQDLLQKSPIGELVKNHLFFFPYVVYAIIVINDIETSDNGSHVSSSHTFFSILISILFLSTIAYLCHSCNFQKKAINRWFDLFYNNDYRGNRIDYVKAQGKKWTIIERCFYFPGFIVLLLIKLYIRTVKNKKVS